MPSGNRIRGDVVEVEVREGALGYERALKKFSVMWKNSGLVRELRFREQNPSRSDRRREKARRAAARRTRRPH
jgi:ribosomal protein S21